MSETTNEYSDPQDFHYEESMVNPATPPTPDLDAVRTALRRLMHYRDLSAIDELADTLGVLSEMDREEAIVTALLAAVSRPAEARGEPVAWGLRDKTTGRINAACGQLVNAEEIRDQLLAQRIDVELVPLYTHPAPSRRVAVPITCDWQLPKDAAVDSRRMDERYAAKDMVYFPAAPSGGDEYGASKWRALEEMAQAVKQGDADENAVVAWMWDALGVRLAAPRPEPGEPSEDTKRLDWLERNGRLEFCSELNASGWRSWSDTDGVSLRVTIDRAAQQGNL